MLIPPGFNTVTPRFSLNDEPALLTFLVEALGGTEIGRHVHDGRFANAQVRLGASTVMVSVASATGRCDMCGGQIRDMGIGLHERQAAARSPPTGRPGRRRTAASAGSERGMGVEAARRRHSARIA